MSIEGSINVSALFHDRDGTTAMKVVSLRSSNEYTGGQVAIITGTAGTAQTTITVDNAYRDATGELVQFSTPERIVFSWSGTNSRALRNTDGSGNVVMLLRSARSEAAASAFVGLTDLSIVAGSGTGTYTVVVYGTV